MIIAFVSHTLTAILKNYDLDFMFFNSTSIITIRFKVNYSRDTQKESCCAFCREGSGLILRLSPPPSKMRCMYKIDGWWVQEAYNMNLPSTPIFSVKTTWLHNFSDLQLTWRGRKLVMNEISLLNKNDVSRILGRFWTSCRTSISTGEFNIHRAADFLLR